MTLVSIIIPIFKCSLIHLRECFDSLASQTMSQCEFILVSDGASEAECVLCEEYVRKDSRFNFFRRPHKGVSATRNYGLSQAKGEYVTFVDSDDWINKDSCKKIYEFAKKCDCDIAFWNCIFFDEKSELGQTSFFKSDIKKLSSSQITEFKRNIIHFSSPEKSIPAITVCKLYKKQFLENNSIQFDETLSFGEDRVFSYQQSCLTESITYLNDILYHCRRHPQSTTKKFTPDSFVKSLNYISKLKTLSNDNDLIGQEALSEFYTAWTLCYMHKDNPANYIQRMRGISKIAKEDIFQDLISKANYCNLPHLQKIELYLLKHKQTFFIWIHGLKHLLYK